MIRGLAIASTLAAAGFLGAAPRPAVAAPATVAASAGKASTRPPRRHSARRKSRRPPPPTAEEKLAKEIKKVWAGRTLRRGTTAVYVVDANDGDVLYAVHENDPLNPASNVKLVATATVLDVLGPDWRYQTRLLGPTPTKSGSVIGDVYLLGNYDPTLTANDLTALAAAVAARGIARIEGAIVVGNDDSRDSLRRPRIEVKVTAAAPGEPPTVTVTPMSELIEVVVTAKTTKRRRARLRVVTRRADADGGERCQVEVSGLIRRGRSKKYRRLVPHRGLFTAHLLADQLREAGVEVTGAVTRRDFSAYVEAATHSAPAYLPIELARHQSAPMGALVSKVNKRSINWLADAILKTAGAAVYGGPPNMANGVRAMDYWMQHNAGIDPAQVTLDTGSGLSYASELSAKHITEVLRSAGGFTAANREEAADIDAVFRASLSVAGRDGTLRRRFRHSHVRGHLQGKSGTLTRIIALSGIISASDDNALLFAIVTNDHSRGYRWRVRRDHETMVKSMYRYLERRAQQRKPRPGRGGSRSGCNRDPRRGHQASRADRGQAQVGGFAAVERGRRQAELEREGAVLAADVDGRAQDPAHVVTQGRPDHDRLPSPDDLALTFEVGADQLARVHRVGLERGAEVATLIDQLEELAIDPGGDDSSSLARRPDCSRPHDRLAPRYREHGRRTGAGDDHLTLASKQRPVGADLDQPCRMRAGDQRLTVIAGDNPELIAVGRET